MIPAQAQNPSHATDETHALSRTFTLLLGHDGVAEGEQPEEDVDLGASQLHGLHQGVVVEAEAGVSQRVEGEVHRLGVLDKVDVGGEERRGG